MAETLTADKIEVARKPFDFGDLFDNHNTRFTDQTVYLLANLNIFLDYAKSIIDDNESLRKFAYDYKWLDSLRALVNDGTKRGILSDILIQKLNEIEKYDKELAQSIRRYGLMRTEQTKLLKAISELISNTENLSEEANVPVEFIQIFKKRGVMPESRKRIDIALAYAELVEEEKLRANIKNRLILIKRYLGETNILNADINDVNLWDKHVHDDIFFFTQRTEAYFKGYQNNGHGSQGIDNFNDEALRKDVFGSREIRILYGVAQLTHRVLEQIEFISGLIEFLQRDMEGNKWVRDVATKEFLDNIENHANRFIEKFSNKPYANALLRNKVKLQEQPFAWIGLLTRMRNGLEGLMPRKNVIIGDAKDYLIRVFTKRMQSLKEMIARFAVQINQIILTESGEASLVEKVLDGIKRIERVIGKIWENRKKRFIKAYDRVKSLNEDVLPSIEELMKMYEVETEAAELARHGKGIVDFVEHKDKILTNIDTPTTKGIPYLLMLDFDFARLSEFHSTFEETLAKIKEKEDRIRNYDISAIKKSVLNLVSAYMSIVQWIRLRIELDTDAIRQQANKFVIEHSSLEAR